MLISRIVPLKEAKTVSFPTHYSQTTVPFGFYKYVTSLNQLLINDEQKGAGKDLTAHC
jgi:hypothetical protein